MIARASSTTKRTMSGYYSHPEEDIFAGSSAGGPPFLVEDVDGSFDSGNLYDTSFSTPDDGGASFISTSTDALGLGFIPTYEGSFPLDHQMSGFPASQSPYSHLPTAPPDTYAHAHPTAMSNFSLGFPATELPSQAVPFGLEPGVPSHNVEPYLSPHFDATLSPNLSTGNVTPASPPSSTRSGSPNSTTGLDEYGIPQGDGTWRCAYSGCRSPVSFARPCDLRKHFHRHARRWFCRYDGCDRSETGALATAKAERERGLGLGRGSGTEPNSAVATGVGYGTRKDRDRHERTHDPCIACPAPGCSRTFARADNMRDHFRRIHGQKDKTSRRRGGQGLPGA